MTFNFILNIKISLVKLLSIKLYFFDNIYSRNKKIYFINNKKR